MMDICRHDPASAELILQDLDRPAMSIVEAEKKVKAYADAHKNGSFACVPPDGVGPDSSGSSTACLPWSPGSRPGQGAPEEQAGGFLDLMDFLG